MRVKESSNSMSYFSHGFGSVSFQCKYDTEFGQSLRLVGNIEELGSWNPQNSLVLTTDPSIYPLWKSSIEISCPVGTEIIYKYVLKDSENNYIWENLPNNENRKFTVSTPGKYVVVDEKGNNNSNLIQEESKKKSKSIMELKADLTESFTKKDLFSYDPNEISNINNELYDTFIFSENQKLTSEDRIIIASMFLPFDIIKGETEEEKYKINLTDENLIFQLLYDMKEKHFCEVFWVGMLKNANEFDEIEIEEIAEFLQEKKIYMVTATENEFKDYQIYMTKIIAPVFIDSTIDVSDDYFLAYENYFSAYQTINRKFANMIHNFIQIKDLLMINDIGLALIPNSLMQKNLYSRVGIYFHMSFPSSDVFRALPKSSELIKSVLLCDVIGFHVFNYARNFLTVLNRDFGIYYEIKHNGFITLNYLGKYIILHIMHAGIDMDSIKKITNTNEFNTYIDKYKKIIGDKTSFLSIDNSTELPQLKLKIDAYEKYLDRHEECKGKTILIQILKMNKDFEELDVTQQDLSEKVILETHTPNERITTILKNLCSDPKNEIYIVTGRKKKFVKTWFGGINNLGLAAEYGFFYKEANSNKNNNENYDEDGFTQLINVKDWSWKEAALNILKEFTEKTEGSKLTLKESSLSWSYKNSDPYFGHIQANEISIHLLNFFGDSKLDIVTGKDYVEIKPKNVNKGFFISNILLKNLEKNNIPDFIFAIGDDTSDEEMFKFLNYVNREQMRVNLNMKIYTTTMGKKPSTANFYITEPGEFVEYLEMMYHHN